MSFSQETGHLPDHFAIQFFTTAAYPCSYLPGRMACSQLAVPSQWMNTAVYSRLIEQGFRRSGVFTYRPHCAGCQACVSLRIPVELFHASHTQRRTWRQLNGLQTRVCKVHYADEHYELYQRYQQHRHPAGGMDAQYKEFLLRSPVESRLIEFRAPPTEPGRSAELKMVCIVDGLKDCLSAVYTFFDPDEPQAGYGTYGILWQIAYARQQHLKHVYLGYWIDECSKMNYKVRFKPFELLTRDGWSLFSKKEE